MTRRIRQWLACRRLEQIAAQARAANSDWAKHRRAQLSPARQAHIAAVLSGFIRERKSNV